MTKIGSWSANISSPAPFLTAATQGETLELRPSGSWTAIHANTLESLFDVALPKLQQATNLKIDMTGVRELDTLGAWLLEKLLRRALESGHPATLVGVAGRHAGLIEDVRKVNRRKPANRTAQNAILARLESAGRATFSAVEEISAFLQMLGALGSAGFGVLRRPRSLRLKSLDLSPSSGRLEGDTYHCPGHFSDRRNHRPARHLSFPQVRCGFLCRRPGRHPRSPRDWRSHRRHHGRRSVGQRLYGRTRVDEDA